MEDTVLRQYLHRLLLIANIYQEAQVIFQDALPHRPKIFSEGNTSEQDTNRNYFSARYYNWISRQEWSNAKDTDKSNHELASEVYEQFKNKSVAWSSFSFKICSHGQGKIKGLPSLLFFWPWYYFNWEFPQPNLLRNGENYPDLKIHIKSIMKPQTYAYTVNQKALRFFIYSALIRRA